MDEVLRYLGYDGQDLSSDLERRIVRAMERCDRLAVAQSQKYK